MIDEWYVEKTVSGAYKLWHNKTKTLILGPMPADTHSELGPYHFRVVILPRFQDTARVAIKRAFPSAVVDHGLLTMRESDYIVVRLAAD